MAPDLTHALIASRLSHFLANQLDQSQCYVLSSPFRLAVREDPLTWRSPDVAILEKSTLIELDGIVHSTPRLIAEVLSPGEDLDETLADYANLRVPEIWIVSPAARTIEVLSAPDAPQLYPMVAGELAEIWQS